MNKDILHHQWCEPIQDFFERIDYFGGWPVGNKFVSFEHSETRKCIFGNEYLNTGWWTTICNSDDYYYWKLSDKKIKEIEDNAINVIIRKLRNL